MSMIELVKNFKTIIKIPYLVDKAVTDNTVFRLHYRTTMLIFFVCCAFVTAYTIFGKPIECIGETKDEGKTKVANTYCYLGFTYTLRGNQHNDPKLFGTGQPHDEKNSKKTYNSYYRWVPLTLFMQGALFYIPHWIWKSWENKKITHLTNSLRGPIVKVKSEDVNRIKNLAKYAAESIHTHNIFASVYYICEILNFINVIFNIYMMDLFLDGEFVKYGWKVLEFTDTPQENRTDPMIEIFPRITKCDFHSYGHSGTIQTLDFMCILALNNLNEKIYIFLWYWLIILAAVSLLPLVYDIAIFISPVIRAKQLNRYNIVGGRSQIRDLALKSQIGDFFIWDLLGRNMSSKCYREFINKLHATLIGDGSSEKSSYAGLSTGETKF